MITLLHILYSMIDAEEIVGFYSSGPKLKKSDLKISDLFRKFCSKEPVFVIIDVRLGIKSLPTTAYEAVEEVEAEGKEIHRVFKHIPCTIGAEEAEEVGVEHLLRDINDPSTSTLALQVKQKISGLQVLVARLTEIKEYLTEVITDRLPLSNKIVYNLQDILNLLPNLNVDILVRSMLIKANDVHMVTYLSSLVRSIVALHALLANKIKYADIDQILDRVVDVESATDKDKEKGKELESGSATKKKT